MDRLPGDRLCRTFSCKHRSVLKDLPESLEKTYEQTLLASIKKNDIHPTSVQVPLGVHSPTSR